MAGREDDAARGELLLAAVLLHADAAYGAAVTDKLGHTRAEAHLAARIADHLHDAVDHLREHIAAHMGVRIVEDRRIGAALDEGFEDEAVRGALGACRELAVGERAGSARAELDVAVGVERTRRIVLRHHGSAPRGIVAALDEERLETRAREHERAEQPGAPGTYHDGTLLERFRSSGRVGARRILDDADIPALACKPRLGGCVEGCADDVGEGDLIALARVDGAFAQLETCSETLPVDAQAA